METLMGVSAGHIGILVWVVWALIGVFEALLAARIGTVARKLWLDVVAGAVAAVAGGYFSIDFVGDGPMQRFLISVLGAVFLGAVVLWIVGRFVNR